MNGWTVFGTIVSGTFVFVLGQIILQFWIVPVQEFRKTIAAIAHARVEVGEVTSNPGVLVPERNDKASRRLRKLSAQLQSHLFLVWPYAPVARLFKLPSRDHVVQASRSLAGLSTSVFSDTGRTPESNVRKWAKICDALGIELEPDARWTEE
jgi:hypothetical protein